MAAIDRVVAGHRREMAALTRRLLSLARQMHRGQTAHGGTDGIAIGLDGVEGHRFSPKGMRSHRKRLNLSADQFGKLLGVSAQSVYAWETGRARPRAKPLAALVALRAMGKRAVLEKLALLDGHDRDGKADE